MNKVTTGSVIYEAVKTSNINFEGIDYNRLAVYLLLSMGPGGMLKCGLEECIPVRKENYSNANSLTAKYNRDMSNWICKEYNYNEKNKREMLARLIQLETIALMSSSCYSFGGDIFLQQDGAGIGERGSACVAKTVMSVWDKWWAQKQTEGGLISPLFIRYVDDVRVYIFPLNSGWYWRNDEWTYDPGIEDPRSQEEKTIQELKKSFNSVLDSILLTTETEKDFQNSFLPTLDFQTHVRDDNEIEFKYFSKPMASGLVIQRGSALSKQTIFSSLRQNLVRRLLNTSSHMDISTKIEIVEDYIQSMVNSGHRYAFIKSVVLQALTRFDYMCERNKLEINNTRYEPLYRSRQYNHDERTKLKYVDRFNWYTDINLKEPFRDLWKYRVKVKGRQGSDSKSSRCQVPTTTTMFVPSTEGGILLEKLLEVELSLNKEAT